MDLTGAAVLTMTVGDPSPSITLDSAIVTQSSLTGATSSAEWPTYMMPTWFTYLFTFEGNTDFKLLVRQAVWKSRKILMVGVSYSNDISSTSGFCHPTTDPEEPEPPEICDELETCCLKTSKNMNFSFASLKNLKYMNFIFCKLKKLHKT